jgi:hypothetical protein
MIERDARQIQEKGTYSNHATAVRVKGVPSSAVAKYWPRAHRGALIFSERLVVKNRRMRSPNAASDILFFSFSNVQNV